MSSQEFSSPSKQNDISTFSIKSETYGQAVATHVMNEAKRPLSVEYGLFLMMHTYAQDLRKPEFAETS